MGAAFDDAAFVEDDDGVGVADGGETVSDDDGGAAAHDGFEGLLDGAFAFGVEGGGGFVEDEDGCFAEDGACYGEALSLAAGEVEATVADEGVVALREGVDELVGVGDACGLSDLLAGVAFGAEGDVGGDGVVEEDAVLGDEAELPAEGVDVEVGDGMAIDGDMA